MNNRILAVTAAALCLLTGCSQSETESDVPEETLIVYQALPLPEIYMEIPESYEETSSQFYEKYYINEDASIIVTEDTNGPFHSNYDYSITSLTQYQSMTHTLDVTSQDVIEAKNCSVQILEFDYTLGEDDAVRMSTMVGYTADETSMYIITCKSDTDTYASHRDEFLSVMKSVMQVKTGH